MNGNVKILIAVLSTLVVFMGILLTAGINHTYGSIGSNTELIQKNTKDIQQLQVEVAKLLPEINHNQDALVEIKSDVREIKNLVLKIKTSEP